MDSVLASLFLDSGGDVLTGGVTAETSIQFPAASRDQPVTIAITVSLRSTEGKTNSPTYTQRIAVQTIVPGTHRLEPC